MQLVGLKQMFPKSTFNFYSYVNYNHTVIYPYVNHNHDYKSFPYFHRFVDKTVRKNNMLPI